MTGEMSVVQRAVTDALWGMCAADSLSMPVHWYYDVDDIQRDFRGWIRGFAPPRNTHPSSILSLSNTGGSGRWSSGPRRPDVVGRLILHDKLDLWTKSRGDTHYHHGLSAGDNTLNALCSLRVALSLVSGGFSDVSSPDARAAVLADYVSFLTTAGSHRDTYAESFHRDFFSCWQEERPTEPRQLLEFAERRSVSALSAPWPDSQLDAIGCLPMILPFVLLSADAPPEQAERAAVEMVKLTHPHPRVPGWVSLYSRALHRVVGGGQRPGGGTARSEEPGCVGSLPGVQQQGSKVVVIVVIVAVIVIVYLFIMLYLCLRFPAGSEQRLRVHQNAVYQLGLACYTRGSLVRWAVCSTWLMSSTLTQRQDSSPTPTVEVRTVTGARHWALCWGRGGRTGGPVSRQRGGRSLETPGRPSPSS
ncbi:uncharacterized protein LOC134861042 isoform X3 [Eleginops maclovinus]|uniref:uncharacterized protein LOC134861042 isoform X3 n=1 Tax=Eleginops maclovinus TaxID=56733 RepID=UPI0030802A6B